MTSARTTSARAGPPRAPGWARAARGAAGVWTVWLATRAAALALEVALPAGVRGRLTGDPLLYRLWAAGLAHAAVPVHDPRWQYPPGAVLALLVPRLLPGTYLAGLVALVLATDAATQYLLVRHARSAGGHLGGAWTWSAGIGLLGPLVLDRFDVLPAALAVLAGIAVCRARAGLGGTGPDGTGPDGAGPGGPGPGAPRRGRSWAALAGAAVALGVLVKVWPVVLAGVVLAAGGWRRGGRWALAGAAAASAAVAAALAAAGELAASVTSFLAHQATRGLQVESLAALPAVVHGVGTGFAYRYRDGAYQLVGPLPGEVASVAALLAAAAALATAAAAGLLTARRGVAAGLDAAAAGLGLVLLLAEVLSPQYLVWLVAVLAVAGAQAGSRVRPAAALAVGACLLTGVLFPYAYPAFLGAQPAAVALLVARDLVLVAAVLSAVLAAVSGAGRGPVPAWGRVAGEAGGSSPGPGPGGGQAVTGSR